MNARVSLIALAGYLLLGLFPRICAVEAYSLDLSDRLSLDTTLENTAICGYSAETHEAFYDRLRADLVLQHTSYPSLRAKLILDNETSYAGESAGSRDDLHNRSSIYRGYVQSRGAKHLWSLGKQRIPLGVGRVWNPIDIFNPIDSEQIEPEERVGTESLRYEYALGDLVNFDSTVARGKVALRLKGYLESADVALVGLWDGSGEQDILGWEIAGQLLDTGLELRSEGGTFGDHKTDKRSTRFIVGAEYGFANSLNLLAEYKFSDAGSADGRSDSMALMASFQPQILWFCRVLVLTDLNDGSYLVAPALEYSLSDEMTLSGGAFLYAGGDGEFDRQSDRYYLNWFVHF